ncbi:carbohydrate ABC transporter permease [Aliigemmobacter aestuarii]|uniref:Carbohydrate ABC transporter permease n=1 Tax=Aliigemmobacter aestuarii TaxID=1445661 RepID=A0A4S3MMT4_9RHOB|nr:carbohydrate ABC transporter permease [Gemmobacter aestuarii]THD83001.1 carbohydrate ABC transporter permease [Gemmobacter aestuarii]
MDNIAGTKSSLVWTVNLAVIALVVLWTIPTFGLLVSSFRDRDQISASGWWNAAVSSEANEIARAGDADTQLQEGDLWVIAGTVLPEGKGEVSRFGTSSRDPTAYAAGETADLGEGVSLTVATDGSYRLTSTTAFEGRSPRIFFTATTPPRLTTENYARVLGAEGLGRAFLNTMTVTIPATVIPILIAAFAAYALAWMEFPGRALLIAGIVGLLVVPLQLALIPLLKLHNQLGIGKEYIGIWLAHSGFGLPLAVYLLRNYMVGLPREIIESARVDGATDFQIFLKIILPLSFPALASFAIFQFLWVWNDLLVATVFLGNNQDQLVMTGVLRELLGSRGGEWEILATSAFVSIFVPLVVFFAMQKYLVRGLLAGSVK